MRKSVTSSQNHVKVPPSPGPQVLQDNRPGQGQCSQSRWTDDLGCEHKGKASSRGLGVRRCWVTGRLLGREQEWRLRAHLDSGPGGKVGSRGIQDDGAPNTACDPGADEPRTGQKVWAERGLSTRRSGVSTCSHRLLSSGTKPHRSTVPLWCPVKCPHGHFPQPVTRAEHVEHRGPGRQDSGLRLQIIKSRKAVSGPRVTFPSDKTPNLCEPLQSRAGPNRTRGSLQLRLLL